jgi:hypothetical protein
MTIDEKTRRVGEVLREAAEIHHRVYAIRDGDDPDWASWYADWLVNLSRLPELLGFKPIRSELTYLLVSLDKQYLRDTRGEPWEDYYARELIGRFAAPSPR